jgi:osmotically inducible protein OsmC
MPVRRATAEWKGDGPTGSGVVSTETGAVDGPYSWSGRFESGAGTNPEELLGAAHAGCFSMALSNDLAKAGFIPDSVRTEAQVHLEKVDGRNTVVRIVLDTVAQVPGIDPETFRKHAEGAKANCPISRVLTGTQVQLNARLA